MRSAIIDDGVYGGFQKIPQITEHLLVDGAHKIVPDETEPYLSHGTRCAHILWTYAPQSKFTSIKVMDYNGRGELEKLLAALRYCLDNAIKLIHLSIGTSNYFDFDGVAEAVKRLTDAGSIIVAAFDNFGTKSLPACLPGVFGVRAFRNKVIETDAYGFDSYSGLSWENSIVVAGPEVIYPNSFAAPVITGKIYGFLEQNAEAGKEKVLQFLIERATLKPAVFPKFFDYRAFEERKVEEPVISAVPCVLQNLYARLSADGYNAVCFCGNALEIEGRIPLQYFTESGITSGLIFVLQRIYRPDIMLFESAPDVTVFDLSIQMQDKFVIVLNETEAVRFSGLEKAYQYIVEYFA